MMAKLEDYALIADGHSAGLVSRAGSIDWLCFPRFDSDACFAALLGAKEHGFWRIAPDADVTSVQRRYRADTAVLETDMTTDAGCVRITDCMLLDGPKARVLRLVSGLSGRVTLHSEAVVKFGYGAETPWYEADGEAITAMAGPDALILRAQAPLAVRESGVHAHFAVYSGTSVAFELAWYASNDRAPPPVDVRKEIDACDAAWRRWSSACSYRGPHRDLVLRSLITLKALAYAPTGAIAAAPTTSLPEHLGGVRNWDYRFCWLRDATLTLLALMDAGFHREATSFRDWLLRTVAGDPEDLQIMYGIAGERRLAELDLPWLPGYEGSRPVRIGNAASSQFQLDVFGEVMDCLHQARAYGSASLQHGWDLQRALLEHVRQHWREPDDGIWEVRSGRKHFTHSKIMAWVAVDRAIRSARKYELSGPVDEWCALRDCIRADVCEHGFSPSLGSFTRAYGSEDLDASLLMIPLVGFLPATDPRVAGTVAAIERQLMRNGLVQRYDTHIANDGLPPGEGVFLACSFWLASNYLLLGRRDDAERLFERLAALANDVGLLSEEYDVGAKRLVGNFPQAFSHLALLDTAFDLYARGPRVAPRSRE